MARGDGTALLAEALGADGLALLVGHYGGLRVRVHTRPRPDTELAQRLGEAVYQRLQSAYAGEEIDIPRLTSASAKGRLERVHAHRAAGLTAAEIARAEGITLRWCRALLAQQNGQIRASKQLDLWP